MSAVLAPGYVLRNGATVVAASARNAHEWVVLAIAEGEYVTWKCSRPGDGSDTRHGHYHGSNLKSAVADYYERA